MKRIFKQIVAVMVFIALIFTVLPPFTISAYSYSVGDVIELGTYPQTLVTDPSITNILNQKTTPWISYNYYTGNNRAGTMVTSDYMKYKDTMYLGEKYRGVVFSQYRPTTTWYKSNADNSYQDENGYMCNEVYWFKYEPIQWIVLDPAEGLLISKNILDSQAFSDLFYMDSDDYYAYNDFNKTTKAISYTKSSLRQWLKYDFVNTALTGPGNDCVIANSYVYEVDSKTYSDTVFIIKSTDVVKPEYGYNSDKDAADPNRMAYGTDYAKIQGLYVSDEAQSSGYSIWRLRDHYVNYSYCTCAVDCDGSTIITADTEETCVGVRPCIKIDFEKYNSAPVTDYTQSPQAPETTESQTEVIVDSITHADEPIKENPLIKRVAQYCYPFSYADFQKDTYDNKWNLNNVSEYNEFVDRNNSLHISCKERCQLMRVAGGIEGINQNEVYCAWNFKEYLSKPAVRAVMGLSGLIFNDEAVGYLVGEWAEKEKYKEALSYFITCTNEEFKELIYISDVLSLLQEISQVTGDVVASNKVNDLTRNLSACITKMEFNNILYNFSFESNGITVPKVDYKSSTLSKIFGTAGDIVELIDVSSKGIANLMSVASEVELYEYYQSFLNDIANDTALPYAMRTAAHELNQDISAQYVDAIAKIGRDINKFAAKKVISLSAENIGSAAFSTALSSVLAGVAIGKIVGNLFFGVSDIVQACAYIECYAILAEKYSKTVLADKDRFNNNVTLENALKFREDYELLFNLRKLGEEQYLAMSGSDSLWLPIIRNTLRNMSGYEEKKEYVKSNLDMLESCRFTMNDDAATRIMEHREIYYETIVIGCPVNVMVYDINDNLVAKTENNIVDDSVKDDSEYPVCIYVDNDIKTIKLSDLSNYRIEIVAFDSGTMTYTATSKNINGDPIKKTNFYDIAISPGDVYTINPFYSSEGDFHDLYKRPNDYDIEWIAPTEQFDENNMSSSYIRISLSVGANGEVVMPKNIYRGDCVTFIAAGNGAEFSGWEENDALISQNNILTFIARDQIELSALFDEVNDTDYSDDSDSGWSFWEIQPIARIILVAIAVAVIAVISATVVIIIKVKRKPQRK